MTAALKSIPGESGMPIVGHTLRYMKNCNQLYDEMYQKYGGVYYNKFLMSRVVHLLSPEANEFVLLDREQNFSSGLAWKLSLKALFPNGLMLRDGEDHRYHRRLMGAPFKSASLKLYVDLMSRDIKTEADAWRQQQDFLYYPAIKQLTLDLATKIFVGETLNDEAAEVNKAFVDLVAASLVMVRYPMFGNTYQKGLEGRKLLEEYFRVRIPAKQQSSDSDMLAEISRVQAEDGSSFSSEEIIDHMIFLMMAAHDTTTSSLSSVCYALARNPHWQSRIRAEIESLDSEHMTYEQAPDLPSIDLVLKEALRLYPPLPTIPRTAIKDCQFEGYEIKRGDVINVSPYVTHRLPEIWSNPDEFDPERFSAERAEHLRHRHAWIPFGGGVHKCLGLKFAELQIKLVLFHMLKKYQLVVEPDYEMPYKPTPIGKPEDELPLRLEPL
ncbi:MAG: cytochrome P450 [Pseudomonadota bacterium]